jgi:hypothetical protein
MGEEDLVERLFDVLLCVLTQIDLFFLLLFSSGQGGTPRMTPPTLPPATTDTILISINKYQHPSFIQFSIFTREGPTPSEAESLEVHDGNNTD